VLQQLVRVHAPAVDAANDIGWLVDHTSHRVLRITSLSSSTNRRVDLVLGQNDLTGHVCNRGHGAGNIVGNTTPNGFCDPAEVVLDAQGNVFVSTAPGVPRRQLPGGRVPKERHSGANGTLQAPLANPVRVYGQVTSARAIVTPARGVCAHRASSPSIPDAP